ncbi:Aspartate aminotransferase, cytoplasmic isozyme 1 [Galdieria sulphuraria]|nr:Aspartate aminotransferase, cytoplasmic isozyme 1 [Galdieria sulphuraria]
MATSHWSHVPAAPPDSILGIASLYRNDPEKKKLNLSVGAYRDDNGNPAVLRVVRKVEQEPAPDHEYIPMAGIPSFCQAAVQLILGEKAQSIKEKRVVTVQSLSGTGALRVGAEFLCQFYRPAATTEKPCVYIPRPSWGNHHAKGLLDDLTNIPSQSIIVLHACAHNPTGADPSKQLWKQILQVVIQKQHLVFFDSAYQGFASGDLEKDAFAVRMFEQSGIEMLIAQSFAKNMGLYGERVGALSFVCKDSSVVASVQSQLETIIRSMYSSPPANGARIASRILNNPVLFEEWKQELLEMSGRIQEMRKLLFEALVSRKTPGDWSHITKQIGMFSFTGLNVEQVRYLREKYHIYMTEDGRASMAGLSRETVPLFADGIHDAVLQFSLRTASSFL